MTKAREWSAADAGLSDREVGRGAIAGAQASADSGEYRKTTLASATRVAETDRRNVAILTSKRPVYSGAYGWRCTASVTTAGAHLDVDIDLRPYLRALARLWRWVVLCAAVGGVVGIVWGSLEPRSYNAQAYVLMSGPRLQLQFEPKIETRPGGFSAAVLQTLALQPDLLQRVASSPELADLAPSDRSADAIRSRSYVSGRVPGLLELRISDVDPERAALIANAWAAEVVRSAHLVFGQGSFAREAVRDQTDRARREYHAARDAYLDFLGNSRIPTLTRDVDQLRGLIEGMVYTRSEAVDPTGRPVRAEPYQQTRLNELNLQARLLERAILDAQTLRRQVELGGSSAAANTANLLAYASLQTRTQGGPANIQLSLSPGEIPPVTVEMVDVLVRSLESQLASIRGLLQQESERPVNPAEQALLVRYETQLASARAALEGELARERELKQAHDLAFSILNALGQKREEVEVVATGVDTPIRVAASALPPTELAPSRAPFLGVVGASGGLLVGVAGVLAIALRRAATAAIDAGSVRHAEPAAP